MLQSTASARSFADLPERDVYESVGGAITLLSHGSAGCTVPANIGTCDAFFAGASTDGTRVLIASNESLTGDDSDGGYRDYYEAAGGVLTLRTPGGAVAGAQLGAIGSADMSVVVFGTSDRVTNADQDYSADLYRSVASAPPPDDVTAPSIACDPADGAWHATNVTLACTASDAESGLADPTDASFTLSTSVAADVEDANAVTDAREIFDVAGNSAVAQVGGNKIDRKAPTVSVTTPAAGAVYVQGQTVLASYSCVDGGSGIGSCTAPVASGQAIDTASTGAASFSVTGTDTVGNSAVVPVAYSVVAAPVAVTPVFAGFPSQLLPVLISNCGTLESPTPCPGDQFDPHVDKDRASYTSDTTVRYYDFFSGIDQPIDGFFAAGSGMDQLSDVSGGIIVFARSFTADGHLGIIVYQVEKQYGIELSTQPGPGDLRTSPAIGGDGGTVAFIDLALTAGGELHAWRRVNEPVRLTNDTRLDLQPAVAPSGNVIVYQSCEISASNCDVHQAAWNGSAWVVTVLTRNTDHESNPDSDDVVVVYDAVRGGERDIHWQPVGGGTEQRLALPGEQRNPSVRGGLVSFESIAPNQTQADLFVYQIATNRLFQITSTPTDDSLNDVSTLADGQFRLVWSEGAIGQRDVLGATIALPALDDYEFGGFLAPVDPFPVLNAMKAGGAVPVKFSLGGDRGLDVFAAGYPQSSVISCDASAPSDAVEQTVTAGGSGLTYDAATDTYAYVWKTSRAWAGTCRQFVMQFKDGDVARANFSFR